jgi:hypothetical protein
VRSSNHLRKDFVYLPLEDNKDNVVAKTASILNVETMLQYIYAVTNAWHPLLSVSAAIHTIKLVSTSLVIMHLLWCVTIQRSTFVKIATITRKIAQGVVNTLVGNARENAKDVRETLIGGALNVVMTKLRIVMAIIQIASRNIAVSVQWVVIAFIVRKHSVRSAVSQATVPSVG